MQIELVRGPDRNDPLDQHVTLVASETVNGKRFAHAVRIREADPTLPQLEEACSWMATAFQENPETRGVFSVQDFRIMIGKLLLSQGFEPSTSDTVLWRRLVTEEMQQEHDKPLLPKDILVELEPMDAKRIKEHLNVAV